MSARLEILKKSLAKKEALFDSKLQSHIDCVKQANGQPLNDKRNGNATLNKWDKQNDSLRTLSQSIEKTKAAIEKEEDKIALVDLVELPEEIKKLVKSGNLIQWRKHPTFFFVKGVERARIHLLDDGTIAHRYVREIPTSEQYAIFRDTFNELKANLNRPQPSLTLQEPNLPKSVSHGSIYDTIERDDLNKRDM
jgi:hypothetical protein